MFYTVSYTGGDFQLLDELRRIQEAFAFLSRTSLPVLHSAPEKPREGFMAVADGVDWNPTGTGSLTPVIFLGGSWVDIANSGGSAGVVTFNGRSGAVAPQQADYDSFFLTQAEADALYSTIIHDHNSVYYTESEIDDFLVGKANTVHTHVEADITDLQSYLTEVLAIDVNSESAPSNTILTADGSGGADWVPLPFTLPADPNADALLMWNNDVLTWEEEAVDWEADNATWGDLSEATEWVTTLADSFITVGNVTQHQGSIDHDALLNFVAAEHIDWSITGAENIHPDRLDAAGFLTSVIADDVDSEAASDGWVLTADGLGGAVWEVPSGGDSLPGDPNVNAILFWDDVSGLAEWGTSIPNSFIPLSAVSQHVTKAFIDGLNVDADTLDGVHGAAFALLAGATFTGNVSISDNNRLILNANAADEVLIEFATERPWTLIQAGTGSSAQLRLKSQVGNPKTFSVFGDGGNFVFSTATGDFVASGDVTANSDIRLKKDFKLIPNALDKIRSLSGYTFYRTDQIVKRRHAGLIAQEVEIVLPEVVIDNEDGFKSVAYGNMVALLIEAIKELDRKIL